MTGLAAHSCAEVPKGIRSSWTDVFRAWPSARGLACATWGSDGRWIILGTPARVLTGNWRNTCPIASLDDALRGSPPPKPQPTPGPGWVALLSYELGAAAEPRGFPADRPADDPAWTLLRLDGGLAINRATGETIPFGDDPPSLAIPGNKNFTVADFHPAAEPEQYQRAVARARAYTHAGDIFQANLAHRLTAGFAGAPRALAAQLFEALDPAFPLYAELPGQTTVISVSPELFLHCAHDARAQTRHIVTRPIKGTRPGAHIDGLERSPKDAAELAMIVDLMRNDLGRFAMPGSVMVEDARALEVHHAGHIAHTSATISARLREGATLGDVLRATMPPGSVTGAPKVRALQVIEELERPLFGMPRGAYCGGLGYLDDRSGFTLNVGIRTLTVRDDELTLPVGAGIVADSDPEAEWAETLAKAAPIVQALGASIAL